jgi:hypothetical protein
MILIGSTLYKDAETASYYRPDGLRISIKSGMILRSPYFIMSDGRVVVHSFNSMREEHFTMQIDGTDLVTFGATGEAEGKVVTLQGSGSEPITLIFGEGDRFDLATRHGVTFSLFD